MPTNFVAAPKPLTFDNPVASLMKSPVERFLAKPTQKASSDKGASSVVNNKSQHLPDDTKLYQDLSVKTGVGGYGEGQTVDTLSKGLNVRAYRPELINEMESAKQFEKGIVNSSYDTKKAKELDNSLFSNTSTLSIESTVGQIRMSKAKAQNDVQNFSNPNSNIAKAFRKNIGEEKYKYYQDFVTGVENCITGISSSDDMKKDIPSFTRKLYDTDTFRWLTNKATGGEMEKFNAAADFLSDKGEVETSTWSKAKKLGGTFIGDSPKYLALGIAADAAATTGLVEGGFAIGGTTGGNMVKLGNTIKQMSTTSPYLYNATVNNALVSVLDFGVQKTMGKDYSSGDFINSLFMGAAVPSVFKLGGDALSGLKNIIPSTGKDLKALNKAVVEDMEKNGSTSIRQSFNNLEESFTFSDGKKLGEKISEYVGKNKKNADSVITHPEVRSALANEGVSISQPASKRVAAAITELNSKLKNNDEVLSGYGDLGNDGLIQIAKNNIISRVRQLKSATDKEVKDIVKEEFAPLKLEVPTIVKEVDDEIDDVFHSKDFAPEKLPEATTIEELGKAIEGENTATLRSSEVTKLRDEIDFNPKESTPASIYEAAKKAGVDVNPDRMVKEGKVVNAYAHEILDRIQTRLSGYKESKSISLKRAREVIAKGVTVNKGTGRLTSSITNSQKEVGRIKKSIINQMASSPEYAAIGKSKLSAIKNKFLTRSPENLEAVDKLARQLSEELHINAFRQMEKDVDTLITKVSKLAKSKSKKNTVSLDYIFQMVDSYKKFNEAKVEGEIMKMAEVRQSLKTFYEEGRSVYKQAVEQRKASINNDYKSVLDVMDSQGLSQYQMRTVNSPIRGIVRGKTLQQNVAEAMESVVPAYAQVERIFDGNPIAKKYFMTNFQEGQNNFIKDKFHILNDWLPQVIDEISASVPKNITKKISSLFMGTEDNTKIEWSMWMKSRTVDGYGHENNLVTDVFMKREGNQWYAVSVYDGVGFKKRYAKEFSEGKIIDLATEQNSDLKEAALSSMYSRFNSLYATSKKFRSLIDEWDNFTTNSGEEISRIMKEKMNKDFVKLEKYFPNIREGKGMTDSNISATGDFNNFIKTTVEDGFANIRVAPPISGGARHILDPYMLISNYLDGSIWWRHQIERVIDADALFNKMKQGREGLSEEPTTLDLFDLEKVGNGKSFDIETNPVMTKEVSQFLSAHIGKVATQGRSLKAGISFTRPVMSKLQSHAAGLFLQGPKTFLKQPVSVIDSFVLGGGDNATSGLRSVASVENGLAMQKLSGYYFERLPSVINKEGYGRVAELSGLYPMINRTVGELNEGIAGITQNLIKGFDAFGSKQAWLTGLSKYLDDNALIGHKAGSYLDVNEIFDKLNKLDASGERARDAINEANLFMTKVMGSNQIVDKAIGSEEGLSKLTWFLGKTGLNHVVNAWDNVFKINRGRYGTGQYATMVGLAATNTLIASGIIAGYFEAINYFYSKGQELIGSKEEGSYLKVYDSFGNEIKEPTVQDYTLFFAKKYISDNIQGPSMTLDLAQGFTPAINQIKKVANAPTTSRKVEEGTIGFASLFLKNDYTDVARYFLSESGIGGTNVYNKKYDTAANQVITQYDKKTPENIDELTKVQMKVNDVNKKTTEEGKGTKKAREDFINDFLKTYNNKPSEENFIQYSKANIDKFKTLGLKKDSDVDSLLTQAQTKVSKTTGEKDSILMGKSTEVIFELQIAPYLDKGDKDGAWNEIKRLAQKGVIKSDSGLENLILLSKKYTPQRITQ